MSLYLHFIVSCLSFLLVVLVRSNSHIAQLALHYICIIRHVHGFLEEIGQGVQHVASRVDDIISFVQEANDRRKVFGEVSAPFLNMRPEE